MLWAAIIVASLGSWLIKIGGLSLPERFINNLYVDNIAKFLPVGILAALITTGLIDAGGYWRIDLAMLGGFGVAVGLLLLRRGFLTVFFAAIVTTALLRLVLP